MTTLSRNTVTEVRTGQKPRLVAEISASVRTRMRIVVLSNLYPPDVLGGYELLTRDVVERLREGGHDVHVLTTGTSTDSKTVCRSLALARSFASAPRRDRLRHTLAYVHNYASTVRFLRSHAQPDVVLAMSLRRLGLGALHALRDAGIPVVATVNDDWPSFFVDRRPRGRLELPRWLLDRSLSRMLCLDPSSVSRVLYLSNAVREYVLESGAKLPFGRVLPQGIDERIFAPREHRAMRSEPRLLFVGRLHPSKAPEVAIDTIAALARRGVVATATMAGSACDSDYEQSLRRRAEKLGIAQRVSWLGHVARDSLPELYRTSDLLLFASKLRHEGQGLTYLEAMACGLPVVAYPSGGALEFLQKHPVAELASRLDGGAFADAVQNLAANPLLQHHRVQAGLDVIRNWASLDTYVRELERELLGAVQS